jgi:hypothetical protein
MATARELVEQLLAASTRNNEGVLDLYAPDAVHEVPFSPSGAPMTMTYDQMRAALDASAARPARFVDQRLVSAMVHETTDGTAIAEYEIVGRVASSDQETSVVGVMVVAEAGGLITRSRNFMDPTVLAALMAP